MIAATLMMIGASAWSDCACFCVDGELQTMCTAVGEAQDNPTLCPTDSSCPQEAEGVAGSFYEAPEGDAVNCREVRVYHAILGEYVTARACNVI